MHFIPPAPRTASCWFGVAGGVGGPLEPPGWLEHSLEQSSLGEDVSRPGPLKAADPEGRGEELSLDWLAPFKGLRRLGWYL
jgi:hypothetical protein